MIPAMIAAFVVCAIATLYETPISLTHESGAAS